VLHRRDDRAIAYRLGEQLAREIPASRLITLDGSDHLPWFGDATQVVGAVLAALGVRSSIRDRVLPAGLTGRELEVLKLVAAGDPDGTIATRLVVSPHTVHRHVANILTKLEVSSRAAAVARAGALGLL
jgi:DNA-binding NarL/FixJ family response regulator